MQFFLVYRVWICTLLDLHSSVSNPPVHAVSDKNRLVTSFLAALSLAKFTSTIAYFAVGCVRLLHYELCDDTYISRIEDSIVAIPAGKLGLLCKLADSLGTAADVAIAITLCVLLFRGRTGARHSDTLINRLILYTVSTGLITGVFVVLDFVAVRPRLWYHRKNDTY